MSRTNRIRSEGTRLKMSDVWIDDRCQRIFCVISGDFVLVPSQGMAVNE